MPPLLNILKDQNQDRYSKLQAIIALGDLAMNGGNNFIDNYITDILKIIRSASQQSLTLVSREEDEDMAAYLK